MNNRAVATIWPNNDNNRLFGTSLSFENDYDYCESRTRTLVYEQDRPNSSVDDKSCCRLSRLWSDTSTENRLHRNPWLIAFAKRSAEC